MRQNVPASEVAASQPRSLTKETLLVLYVGFLEVIRTVKNPWEAFSVFRCYSLHNHKQFSHYLFVSSFIYRIV